jgi:hypothetical protein
MEKLYCLLPNHADNKADKYDRGAKDLVADILFLEDKFSAYDRDDAGGLFEKRHYYDFRISEGIGDKQRFVRNKEQETEYPDPAVLPHGRTYLDASYDKIHAVEDHKIKHVPKLKLRRVDILHVYFIEASGYRIANTGSKYHPYIYGWYFFCFVCAAGVGTLFHLGIDL